MPNSNSLLQKDLILKYISNPKSLSLNLCFDVVKLSKFAVMKVPQTRKEKKVIEKLYKTQLKKYLLIP